MNSDIIENTKIKDAAAIIYIIANTGLRRGDKIKFNVTGNRGVSTLAPANVTVSGNKVSFSFIGKSYQENVAHLINKDVANYISVLKKSRKDEAYLFDTNDNTIDLVFGKVGGENLKLKDLRTYVATDLARKILFEDKTIPPPLTENTNKSKKLVQDKLKRLYEIVSKKLNNTPAMARTAYIAPNVVNSWLDTIGFKDTSIKKAEADNDDDISLDEIISRYPASDKIGIINDADEEMCDEFNLPTWWME